MRSSEYFLARYTKFVLSEDSFSRFSPEKPLDIQQLVTQLRSSTLDNTERNKEIPTVSSLSMFALVFV